MFGIGSLVGNIAGGFLDKVGLGGLTPFVKMGLDAFTGNWLGVAKDVFDMVSGFKGGGLDGASKMPPLGGFDNPQNGFSGGDNPLQGNRLSEMFNGLKDFLSGLKSLTDKNPLNDLGGLGKIFKALQTLTQGADNNQLFNNRLSISQFTNIQV
ncbi:MAG: hypothetical protein JSS81_18440 [Acidobacteria bacterium]|nr:hypothetical protein [Acidobacteriota bacterium]